VTTSVNTFNYVVIFAGYKRTNFVMKNSEVVEKQVVTYFRVSSLVQDNERQYEDVQKYCANKGFKVIGSFEEKESGLKKVRPELTSLLNFVKSTPNIKYCIISELSRIGRTHDVLNIIDKFHSLNIGLMCLKENFCTLNNDGTVNSTAMLVLTIMSGINTAELSTLKYRIKSGLLNSVRNGHAGGSKNYPFGFTKGIDKMLIINETEAVTVRQIFEMSNNGKGTKVIANYLNNSEIKTRQNKKWRDAVVYGILTNSIYKGQRNFRGEVFTIEQIVNTELFDSVNTKLGNGFHKQGINKKYEYLLDNQAVTCGVCGKSFFAHKRASGKDNVYKCISSRYGERCSNSGVNIDKLESAITDIVVNDFKDVVINRMTNGNNFENDLIELNKESKEVLTFIKKQEFKESNLIDLFTDGILTKEKFNEKLKPVTDEKIKLNNQLLNVKSNIVRIEKNLKLIKNKNSVIKNLTSNSVNKKEVINSIVSNITVFPTERHLTGISNDITVMVEFTVWMLVFRLYISNRTKEIKVIKPYGHHNDDLNQSIAPIWED